MSLNLLKDKGVPLDQQRFTWKDMVGSPISKLDADAFTRVRIILMNGIEMEALRFSHSFARMSRALQRDLAVLRRTEQHQATMINWLLPADQSVLETTIGYEQVAIEVTACVAHTEPDEYLAQVYRFGLLEDFDHMYRYAALMDRVEGKDANTIVQSYSDILPGRPTSLEHRHPIDDVRHGYDARTADIRTKFHQLTILAGEQQTHNYYMNVGPTFADPIARQLYAEIASIEEQHVTQYESIGCTDESLLEKWLLHEANEVYNYYACVESERDPHVKKIWERFLDYELGHLRYVAELFEDIERRDAAEVLPRKLPEIIRYESHRELVRDVLREEVELSASGPEFIHRSEESKATLAYRKFINSQGSPSDEVAAGFVWRPGTELVVEQPQGMHVPRMTERVLPVNR